jgi:NADH-quinone oxidoreductase subunit J
VSVLGLLLGAQTAQNVFFWIIAVVIVAATLRMLTTRNVVHAALSLVVVLGGLGAIYLLLAAEFIATTQVLVYIGAVMVLFLFGIMLTRARIGHEPELTSRQWPVALLVALVMAGVLGYALIDAFEDSELPTTSSLVELNTEQVSDSVFSTYLLPFEAVSVLLLAALIGAIVLARRD